MLQQYNTTFGGHLGVGETVRLFVTYTGAMLFLHYPEQAIRLGNTATWQFVIILVPIALLVVGAYTVLARRFPGQNLHQIAEAVTGPIMGALLSLVVAVALIGLLTLNLREFTETFKTTILPNTPVSVISASLALCACVACWAGLESIARVSQFLFFPIYFILALLIILNIQLVDTAQFFPLWGQGLVPTLRGAVSLLPLQSELALLLVVGQVFRSPTILSRVGRWTVLINGLALGATLVMMIGVFGAPEARLNPFSLYGLARIIQIGRWIERVEVLIVTFWVLAAALRLSLLLCASTSLIASVLRIPNHRSLIFPLLVLVESLSLMPQDLASLIRTDRLWLQTAGLAVLGIPFLLLMIALIRKKGGATDAV
jgi:spore germination protein KB